MSEKKYLSKKFSAMNIYLLLAGVLLIIIGYILLKAYNVPYNHPVSMSVAPVFLVLGYLVFIPAGLLYKKPIKK